MRNPLSAILIVCMITTSCNNTSIVNETRYFNNNTWLRFEPEVYKFEINNIDAYYNTIITVCFDTSVITDRSIPLVVDFFSDSNEIHNYITQIKLRDRKGQLYGQTVGGFCTVSDTIDRYRIYNRQGSFTYKVKQGTSRYELRGINSLSFQIVKSNVSL